MVEFEPFLLERIMGKWEHRVDYNLSESGVHPIKVHDLCDSAPTVEQLLNTDLGYPECNGDISLREAIAAMYPSAGAQNVIVTVGCAEANFISVQTLLRPGDEIVVMLPNYLQIWGLARNFGLQRKAFHLREELNWGPDLAELEEATSSSTKVIAICNPNNPTGSVLRPGDMDAIVKIADKVGAWILADETYAGTERLGESQTPSFWGRYDKVLVTASLSKAYGLPGLRTGWVLGPADTIEQIWMRHDYTTITATMLANKLATIALSPSVMPSLIRRGREFIRRGYPVLEAWLEEQGNRFSLVPPSATGIAFVRYSLNLNSTLLAERLIEEKRVFVVPGDCFGMDGYLRIGFGVPAEYLRQGLERVGEFLRQR